MRTPNYLKDIHKPGSKERTHIDNIVEQLTIELEDYNYSTHLSGWISSYDNMKIYISNRRNKLSLESDVVKYNVDRMVRVLDKMALNPNVDNSRKESISIHFDKP